MLTVFGFSWLLYSVVNNITSSETEFISHHDLSGILSPITDYVNDTNNLLSYLTNIGNGIFRVYSNLPPLIHYFLLVCIIITIVSFFIRVVLEII